MADSPEAPQGASPTDTLAALNAQVVEAIERATTLAASASPDVSAAIKAHLAAHSAGMAMINAVQAQHHAQIANQAVMMTLLRRILQTGGTRAASEPQITNENSA